MKETERIEDQLKRAFEANAWHGPSVNEALEGVTPEMAVSCPVEGAHSIWELVHHIGAWADIVRRSIEGEKVNVTEDVNFPPVKEVSKAAWKDSLTKLDASQRAIRKLALSLPESRLNEVPAGGKSTVYVLLHGVVQHAIYHAGQIVLLKKA